MAYEKMNNPYESERDLMDRLGGTICRYDGVPYWVQVESSKLISLLDVVTQKLVHQIKPNDPLFDVSSMECGYMNWRPSEKHVQVGSYKDTKNIAVYIERMPYRKYRQGINSDCTSSKKIDGTGIGGTHSFFQSQGFVDSIQQKFPLFEHALFDLEAGREREVAISQETALQAMDVGVILVWHRCCNIGYIIPETRKIITQKGELQWVWRRELDRVFGRKKV